MSIALRRTFRRRVCALRVSADGSRVVIRGRVEGAIQIICLRIAARCYGWSSNYLARNRQRSLVCSPADFAHCRALTSRLRGAFVPAHPVSVLLSVSGALSAPPASAFFRILAADVAKRPRLAVPTRFDVHAIFCSVCRDAARQPRGALLPTSEPCT